MVCIHIERSFGHGLISHRGAARGALGYVRGVGDRWVAWPPLPGRVPRAHEVSAAQRVMRAAHAFGVLAIPVPVGVENQIHLAECPIIRREFWRHFFRLMCEVGFSTPLVLDELTAMLITGALTDTIQCQ